MESQNGSNRCLKPLQECKCLLGSLSPVDIYIYIYHDSRLVPGGVEPLKKYNKMQGPEDKMPINERA